MKILLTISTGLVNAGVPNVIMKLVDFLNKYATFDIIVIGKEKCYYDYVFESYGGHIFYLPKYNSQKQRIRYSYRAIEYVRAIKKIILENGPYDILHCNDGIGAGAALIAAKDFDIPIKIVHSHGTYKKYKSKNPLLKIQNKIYLNIIRNSDIIRLACSTVAGESLYGKGSKFINVYNPVDIQFYKKIKQIRPNDVFTNKVKNLLQIGYYCDNKNQLFSIKLVKSLISKGKRVQLFLLGFEFDKQYFLKIKTYIESNGLSNYIKFLPHDYDKKEILSKTDILVLPSYSEGLPLVLLEAQASGIKCVVSDTVSKDSDVGLCKFINLTNVNNWEEEILSNSKTSVNESELLKFDTGKYISRISDIYNLKQI
ncbi:MAG: glycosyltransferase [Pleomorphochaeta sp.]